MLLCCELGCFPSVNSTLRRPFLAIFGELIFVSIRTRSARATVMLKEMLTPESEIVMANEWIEDVIEDLRKFAEMNSLPQLAYQLEVTSHVAASEIGYAGSIATQSRATYANIGRAPVGQIAGRSNA